VGDTLNSAVFPIPQWVKLERSFSGDITAYHANDVGDSPGTWQYINMVQIPMNEVYVGLALTSAAAYTPCTAVFSHVSIEGDVTEPQFTFQEIGIQNNDAETVYVSIKDAGGASHTVSHPDPDAVLSNEWAEWPIALSQFEGVNLANVDSMSIGFGAKGGPPTGAEGLVFVDDIRLYAPRCLPDLIKPAADFSNDCVVDMADLEILTDDWLLSGYDVTVAAASDANLVLHYKFDGNASDSSGNGYNGVVLGSPTYIAGPSGQAMSFDGVFDYVAIDGLSYAETGMTEVSVAAWIRTESEDNQIIASFDRSEYWRLEINGEGAEEGRIAWDVMTHDGQADLGGASRVDDGQWHHVAGVFDNGATVLYIDGKIDVMANVAGTIGTGDLRYGFVGDRSEATEVDGDKNTPPWMFEGDIDDLRIYNRAVPQAEIANLAGMAVGSTLTQPVSGLLSTAGDSDLEDDERIDFVDYAALLDAWLDEALWPQQ